MLAGDMPDTIQLKVTGMTCAGCEAAVSRALQKLPGVDAVHASHAAAEVGVTFDASRVTPAEIAGRIAALGYEVHSATR
jgi:copper chaperone CopZ